EGEGNRTSLGGLTQRTFTYNERHQVTQGTDGLNWVLSNVTYDPAGNGNMTTKTLNGVHWQYDWTAENRLKSVRSDFGSGGTPTAVAEMIYDSAGQRVQKNYHSTSGTTITTTYIGKMYEERTFTDSRMPLHTLYIYTPSGQLVETWTREQNIVTASKVDDRWQKHL